MFSSKENFFNGKILLLKPFVGVRLKLKQQRSVEFCCTFEFRYQKLYICIRNMIHSHL